MAKKPKVKCPGCGATFYREDEEHINIGNRYWHATCYTEAQNEEKKSAKAIEELEAYICKLFDTEYVSPRIRKQINFMVNNYKYTYSGILRTLQYWFGIRGESVEKANGGIGI